jgi:CBS domain-containing protein
MQQAITIAQVTKDVYSKKNISDCGLCVTHPYESISSVLHRLYKKGLISMPVLDGLDFVGSISVYDIMKYFLTGNNARKMDRPILKVMNCIANFGGKQKLRQLHWIPFPLSGVLTLEALLDPFSTGMHRILVEVSSPDGIIRQIRNLSQTDVLRFLLQNQFLIPQEMIISNLNKLKAVSYNVMKTKTTDKVVDAFQKLNHSYVSALAVVDQEGKLVSTLSISDLRFITSEVLSKMNNMTVHDFLTSGRKGNELRKPVLIDEFTHGIMNAVSRMLLSQTHRLWLVDDLKAPSGVLTMSDIFRVLARRPNLGTPRNDDGTPFVSRNYQWGEDYEPENQ